jgi:mannose-1-phosphate guanylyltransferase/mannose-6-phosphate isomerase
LAIIPVILCGGPGSRLWPASTLGRPKPFLDLLGGPTLFQQTCRRMAAIAGAAAPVVVTNAANAAEVRRQLLDLGLDGLVITEPMGRDSAPALLAATLWIARKSPDAIIVAVASDHHIPDVQAFAEGVETAAAAAAAGAIVTFGVRPTYPATGFGYIRPAAPLESGAGVLAVERFIEKPDRAIAGALLESGCLWNSGNFVFRAGVMIEEAAALAPGLAESVRQALPTAPTAGGLLPLGPGFAAAPRVSIDVAVMERTSRAAVVPIDYHWSDLGSWDAVWEASVRDASGNAIIGEAVTADSRDCLVRADDGARIVAMGVRGVAIVARGKDVLVTDLSRAPQLKTPLAELDSRRAAPAGLDAAGVIVSAADRLSDWLLAEALPLWWCFGADHAGGGFHEALDLDRSPTFDPRRARVQARQVFVYATAGRLGWRGPWQVAIGHGLDDLAKRYKRPDGLYRASIRHDGSPHDEAALLYDQAFVLLALASAARPGGPEADGRRGWALDLARTIRRRFAHDSGGFAAHPGPGPLLANPIMHLFEASLAWAEIDDDPVWRDLAEELAELFVRRLFDAQGGRIFEVFDGEWRPSAAPQDRLLEPGHHFEWAWLLERWGRSRNEPEAAGAARTLYAAGRRGVHPSGGLVVDAVYEDSSIARASSRLWPQTEWLKAALLLEPAGPGREREAGRAAAAIERYLTASPRGLWADAPLDDGGAGDAPALASSFYHIVGAIFELHAAANELRSTSASSDQSRRDGRGQGEPLAAT